MKYKLLFALLSFAAASLFGGTVKLGDEFFQVTDTVKTPSVPFLKPYVNGKIKALFLVPRFGAREVVELSQRMDIEHTVIMFQDVKQLGDDLVIGAEQELMLEKLDSALALDYDLIVIGNIHWDAIPEEQQFKILKKVSDGAGLAYCSFHDRQQPEIFKELFTSADAPFAVSGKQERYQFQRLRDGRVLLKHGFGGIAHHHCLISKVVTRLEYENAMAQLIRSLAWLSKKYEPRLKIQSRSPERIEFAPVGESLELTLYDGDCNLLQRQVLDNSSTYEVPDLPGGVYSLFVRLVNDKGNVLDGISLPLEIRSATAITSLTADKEYYRAGDIVSLNVESNSDGRYQLELRDNYRRILLRQDFPSGPITFTAPENTTVYNIARISLVRNGKVAAVKEVPVYIHSKEPDGFLFGSWVSASGDNYLGGMLGRRMSAIGFDSALWTTADANLRPMPIYNGGLNYSGADRVRTPCLSNPKDIETLSARFQEVRRNSARHNPIGYTLGDEPNLSVRVVDVCTSPACLAHYRRSLKRQYSDISGLNKAWGSHYKDWAEILPLTGNEAKKKQDYASWLTHRLNMDQVLNEYLGKIQTVAGDSRIGKEGIWNVRPTLGVNWYTICRSARLVMPYPSRDNILGVEAVSSFAPRSSLTGGWSGSYKHEIENLYELSRKPWLMLLHNANSLCWYNPFSYTHSANLMSGILPDYRVSANLNATLEQVNYIKRGVDRVIFDSERSNNGIAVLYSQPSLYYSASHDFGVLLYLLEDLGWNYRMIDISQLNNRDFKVLFLDHALLLGESEVGVIQDFIRNGGKVIADVMPATHNEAGVLRKGSSPLSSQVLLLGKLPDNYPFLMSNPERRQLLNRIGPKLEASLPEREASVMDSRGERRGDCEIIRYVNSGFEVWGILRRDYLPGDSTAQIEFPEKLHVYTPQDGKYLGYGKKFDIDLPCGPPLLLITSKNAFAQAVMSTGSSVLPQGDAMRISVKSDASPGRPRYFQVRLYRGDSGFRITRNLKMTQEAGGLTIRSAINEQPGSWKLQLHDPLTGAVMEKDIQIVEK